MATKRGAVSSHDFTEIPVELSVRVVIIISWNLESSLADSSLSIGYCTLVSG